MTTFAHEMARQEEDVSSPDGNIVATVTDGSVKGLAFRPGTYERYTETVLAPQIEQLAKLIFVTRARARRRALRIAMGSDHDIENRDASSPAERQLREDRKHAVVSQESAHIFASVEGGIHWDMEIDQGTLEILSEDQFLEELGILVKRTINAWRTEMNRLRRHALGPSEILRGLRMSNSRRRY